LDHEKEQSSIEYIDLIVLLKSILLLVFLHEGAVADSIHVGSELHRFRCFPLKFNVASRFINFSFQEWLLLIEFEVTS